MSSKGGGRGNGGGAMQESYLAACLEAGFKTVKTRRLNVVGRCPEFTLMEKPWKELVKLAVLETEIPGQDEGKPSHLPQGSDAVVAEVDNNQRFHLLKMLKEWSKNLQHFDLRYCL